MEMYVKVKGKLTERKVTERWYRKVTERYEKDQNGMERYRKVKDSER